MEKRAYSFSMVTYENEETIKEFVKNCKKWFYIKHDRDEAEPHYHIVCTFEQQKSYNSVRKLIGGEQNTRIEELKNRYAMYRYVTHANEEHKAEYKEEEIVTNDREHFKPKEDKGEEVNEFINDLLEEVLTIRQMAHKYGRDYMKNLKNYKYFKEEVKLQERNREKKQKTKISFPTIKKLTKELKENGCTDCKDYYKCNGCTLIIRRIMENETETNNTKEEKQKKN